MPVEVRLRPVETEDVDTVAAFLAHPDLVGRRGLEDDPPIARSVAALRTQVEAMVDPEDGEAWVVDAGSAVGLVIVDWWWDALTPWVHVVVDPRHQRMGHGTSAAGLVLTHLFEDTPAVLVEYAVPSWDASGLSFADGLGGSRVGARRRTGIRKGRYFDQVEFVLSRSDWEGRRGAGR